MTKGHSKNVAEKSLLFTSNYLFIFFKIIKVYKVH